MWHHSDCFIIASLKFVQCNAHLDVAAVALGPLLLISYNAKFPSLVLFCWSSLTGRSIRSHKLPFLLVRLGSVLLHSFLESTACGAAIGCLADWTCASFASDYHETTELEVFCALHCSGHSETRDLGMRQVGAPRGRGCASTQVPGPWKTCRRRAFAHQAAWVVTSLLSSARGNRCCGERPSSCGC